MAKRARVKLGDRAPEQPAAPEQEIPVWFIEQYVKVLQVCGRGNEALISVRPYL